VGKKGFSGVGIVRLAQSAKKIFLEREKSSENASGDAGMHNVAKVNFLACE